MEALYWHQSFSIGSQRQPVVAVTPVIGQRLDLGEWGALGPVVDCLRVRPAGLVDAAVEVLDVRLRDGEGEGGDGVIGHGFLFR